MRAKRREHPERDDAKYLELRRAGKTIEMISLLCGVSLATVHKGIAAAKDRQRKAAAPVEVEPPAPRQPAWVREVVPMFPIKALFGDFLNPTTPENACPHNGPIARGSKFVCMICHQSGMDHHPALRRDPATDPKPEKKPKSKVGPKPTRRERRRTAA